MISNKDTFFKLRSAHYTFDRLLRSAWYEWRKSNGITSGRRYIRNDLKYELQSNHVLVTTQGLTERIPLSFIYGDVQEVIDIWTVSDYYDGPLHGLAMFRGNLVWYTLTEGSFDDISNSWAYELYTITEEEIQNEISWHNTCITNDITEMPDQMSPPVLDENNLLGVYDECYFHNTS